MDAKDGRTGYMVASCFTPSISRDDRGAILSVHLSRPYEFEGDIDAVDKVIEEYQGFAKRFPESSYLPEASLNAVYLDIYALQIVDSREKNVRAKRILKNLDSASGKLEN